MKTTIPTKQQFLNFKKQRESIGMYYLNDTHQTLGYYKDGIIEPKDLIVIAVLPINSPFSKAFIESAKTEMESNY
jgi:hypothetical protein